jgi:hypothetical protein
MKITEAKKGKNSTNKTGKKSKSLIKEYSDKSFRDRYQEHPSIAFISKRSVKAGDLSGVSGKSLETQRATQPVSLISGYHTIFKF